MAYCVPKGIPHSFFMGGPNQWTQEDRDKAIEWELYDRTICPRCRTFPEDWLDPETRIPYVPPPYIADSVRCHGCKTLDDAQKQVRDQGQSLYFHLVPWRTAMRTMKFDE